jgi:hypothetical protein
MTTSLASRRKCLRKILEDIADEATQHISWFGLDPKLVDSPGDQICALFGSLESSIADEEMALPSQARETLIWLGVAVRTYQQEVGPDPDPAVTIDHPKWREIRAMAREALSFI